MIIENKNISLEEEQRLIEESKANPKVFKAIYDAFYAEIYRYVYARTRDKEDCNEIVSNVFFKSLKNLSQYKFQGFSIKVWIYRIAQNEIKLFARNHNRKATISISEETVRSINEQDEAHIDNIPQLISALNQLPDEEVELIEMKYYEGRSHKEISEILDISLSNAKVKLHRAVKNLKNIFKTS